MLRSPMGAYKSVFCQNEPNMCPVFIDFQNLRDTNSRLGNHRQDASWSEPKSTARTAGERQTEEGKKIIPPGHGWEATRALSERTQGMDGCRASKGFFRGRVVDQYGVNAMSSVFCNHSATSFTWKGLSSRSRSRLSNSVISPAVLGFLIWLNARKICSGR